VRILAVGDSFFPTGVFRRALERLESEHSVEYLQVDASRTPPDLPIREYEGDPAEIAAHMPGVDALVVHGAPVVDEVLAASEALRLICCARGGPVNVDLGAASARGLPVVTTPGKNADSVADQTLAFLVMLARRFPHAQRFLLDGHTVGESAFEGAQFFGHDLGGHTLGLVGYGNVGHRVARRARAFDMEVVVFDPFLDAETDGGVEQVGDLSELLARADFVSVHARATPENENLFDHDAFARMRPGAYFVNTARETLVDEDALDAALESGHLAGAALDVVHKRADSGPHPLLRHDNVVLTPHIGGATHETLLHGALMVAAEIERLAAGAPLVNVINRDAVGA
jgi:D-3-phosphoglycerate dehydrogenase / 2-oxoglutarate reductase